MKIKQITSEAVKVTAVDTSTGNVTYKDDITGVSTIVPKGMATPTAPGITQVSAQQIAPGQPGAVPAMGVKVGDQVKVLGQTPQAQQTMGSMEEDEESLDRYSGEHDPDIDDTTARQVRRMAHELENRWGSYEDWGQEELESIAMDLQISTAEVADALGLDSSQFGHVSGDDDEIWEDDIEQVGQPYDDQQMEAIKRLAGL